MSSDVMDSGSEKFFRVEDGICLALLAVAFAFSAFVYDTLPGRMPIHFDASGAANGWTARHYGAYVLPVVAAGLWALLRLFSAVPAAFRILLTLLFVGVHFYILHIARG